MINFFQNCWQWIVNNKEGIYTFFTSANFIAFISTLTALIKCIKTTNKNTISNDKITEGLSVTNGVKSDVDSVKNTTVEVQHKVEEISNAQKSVEDKLNSFIENITTKVDAMLEVQTIVYSTIKDDTIRNSVNTILIDAKHCEAKAKEELRAELEQLKEDLTDVTNKLNERVVETVDKVEGVMHVGNTEDHTVRRY